MKFSDACSVIPSCKATTPSRCWSAAFFRKRRPTSRATPRTKRDARVSEIARVIRSAGLANEKARYIKHALQYIERERGAINLDFLNDLSERDARKWLMQMEGVGPKTASIVLLFAQKRNVFPVDTHVHRVTRRLGWIDEKTSAEQAHQILEGLIPPQRYYAMHINLIRLGREICHARNPRCEICPLKDLCKYYRQSRK
ncbi:MAG: Fe-S cluster assembly protein HesB [Chloroflexi bacterium]|nr:MAG: Fe-S cluster assembly protein HesB [Chloroflexota bacterium]